MCICSQKAQLADTKIFARSSKAGRQFLVYSMKMKADEDLALILPLPVPKKSGADDLKFINLEKYPEFFAHMGMAFLTRSNSLSKDAPPAHKLEVVDVGSFQASYVPALKDFERLDERFRLPKDVWNKLPMYADYGFAVFKLKKEAKHIHPMAFEFPRANPKQLFFPTVHVHDREVHAKADFDHALYCQPDEMLMGWTESPRPAGMYVKRDLAQGLIDPDRHYYRKLLRGNLKNEDVLV